MLSTALQAAEQLLGTVAALPAPPPPADQVKAQLAAAGGRVLPTVAAAQSQLRAFTERAVAQIDSLSQQVAGGADPADATAVLHAIGTEFDAQSARLSPLMAELDGLRDEVAKGVGSMSQEQTALGAQLAGLAAQRDHWQAQLDQINQQNTIVNTIGIFVPFLPWAGGEIASEIQYGQSTEQALAQASSQLAQVAAQSQQLQAAINVCTLLGSAFEQLSGAVQNLANATSLVRADLSNDAVRAAVATPTTLKLFLASLRAAVQVLRNGVA